MTTSTRTPARYSLARAWVAAHDEYISRVEQGVIEDTSHAPVAIAYEVAIIEREIASADAFGAEYDSAIVASYPVVVLPPTEGEHDSFDTIVSTFRPDPSAWFDPNADDSPSPEGAPEATVALVGVSPTLSIQSALDGALGAIQRTHANVPSALAVVISQGSGKKHGHFEANSWVDTEGAHAGSARHEILISSESLSRTADLVLTTLIHEAAHALAHATGVKDTSRQGRYHGTKFRQIANDMGLVTALDSKIGTVTVGLNSWAADHYREEIEVLSAALTTHRVLRPAKAKGEKTTVKVACACTKDNGQFLSVTVPIAWFEAQNLICNDCEETLAPVEDN